MQIEFEEIEIPHFPGALFHGSADVEWCHENEDFWVTTIQFGSVIYTRADATKAGLVVVWDALMDEIIRVYADDLDELRPIVRNEHELRSYELV